MSPRQKSVPVEPPDPSDDQPDKPSKSQRKRDMHELQALGVKLVELNADQLDSVEMPEDLRDAIMEARRIKSHEGKRRQLQYIGRLMRDVDPAPIRERIDALEGRSREHAAHEHEIARWRDRLLEGEAAMSEAAMAELASQHAGLDLQHLRTLVRNAKADQEAGRPPRHYRELFRALRDALYPTRTGKADE
jgi:ribosome-associated protein